MTLVSVRKLFNSQFRTELDEAKEGNWPEEPTAVCSYENDEGREEGRGKEEMNVDENERVLSFSL